jgi:WD40 repeat protein
LWEIAGGKKIRTFSWPEDDWRLLGFDPDGKTLAVKGAPDTLHFRDVQTGKRVGGLRLEHPTWINQLLLCCDGKTLVSYSFAENALRLWDHSSGKELRSSGEASSSIRCVFSPDGRFLAIGAKNGVLRLWDVVKNKEAWRTYPQPWLSSMLFSPDSRLLVTNNTNYEAMPIREVSGGKEVKQLDTVGLNLTSLAWSRDGKLLAAWPLDVQGDEGSIGLWDPKTGKKVGRLSGTSPINYLLFSPDRKTLLGARNGLTEGEVLRWRVNTGRRLPPFEGPVPGGLKCLAISPDGRTVAAGALDRSIYLWEAISGRRRATLKTDEIATSLAFSPDGKVLAAASNSSFSYSGLTAEGIRPGDGRPRPPLVHLWDMAAEKELPPLQGHKGSITSLSFSPDGKLLATGSNDTTALLWDATRFKTSRPMDVQLRPEQIESLWAALGAADAVRAYRAIRTLAAAPKASLAFLKRHLHPILPADAKQVARLLADLDSEQFEVREKAMQELEKLGARAATELHKVLADKPSLEVKRRIELLLEKQNGKENLRIVRALETLERIDTSEARDLCRALAGGVSDAPLTREARATLRRMAR